MAVVLVGLAVLTAYLLPGLSDPATRWPLWDARVYWWGGQQAARDAALYVLCGLAVLAGVALLLARESLAGETLATAPARTDRIGQSPRRSPSLIGWTMAWSPEIRLPIHPPRRHT